MCVCKLYTQYCEIIGRHSQLRRSINSRETRSDFFFDYSVFTLPLILANILSERSFLSTEIFYNSFGSKVLFRDQVHSTRMTTESERYRNIERIELNFTLENLQNFKEFRSEIFYVRGNPWSLRFSKSITDNQSFLAVFLLSKIKNQLGIGAVMADFSAKLLSRKFDGETHTESTGPMLYEINERGWGRRTFMKWDELVDPEKGYVHNDMCKLVVKVKASPLQIDDQLLEFVPIPRCCDGTSRGKFRIKVNEVIDFVDVCSPSFNLKNFRWRISVSKSENNESGYFLQIQLYNLSLAPERCGISCTATITHKLVPFDSKIEPFVKKVKNRKFSQSLKISDCKMIPWNEMMKPEKKFVQNNSFELEIVIKIEEAKEQEAARALKRAAYDKNNQGFIRIECPICFQWLIDQPISLLSCGHMYCTVCIVESLKQKKICPLCLKESTENELRKVHLPAK